MNNLLKHHKWIFFFIALLAVSSIVTPVLADYLGPNRTVTTTTSVCKVYLYKCTEVETGKWDDVKVEDWLCSNESKPWLAYDSGGGCFKDNENHKHWEKKDVVQTITITHPSATITGSIQNCTSYNGWCNGGSVPELALSANEPLSGYNITLIEGTLNGTSFACQNGAVSCNLPMGEGDNNFHYWALSSWGDSSRMGTSSARVDTVPPDVSLSVTGTMGHNGWYKSVIDVSAIASDATSGVATFEVAADGGGYQGYTPIAFDDGRHTLQFRVVDNAGNVFEAPVQNFNVDTIPPTIDLPVAWRLGRDIEYSVRDEGSGLASVRIVIEDEDEKYAKVTWDRNASGKSYTSHIDWDGLFKDKTAAAPGTYYMWVKAQDNAGNERFQAGKIIVPEPNVPLAALPTADPLATDVALLPPAELVEVDTVPVTAGQSAVEGVVSPSEQTTTQTILLTTGSAGAAASTTTTSGILWGAAAAAAIAAATTYALDVTRKRKEAEEAQAERVRAEVAEDKARRAEHGMTKGEKQEAKAQQSAAHDAKVQERKERQSWANPAKEKALLKEQEERDEAYWAWLQQQKAEEEAAKKAQQEAAAAARVEKKLGKIEAMEEERWAAAQAVKKEEEKKKAEEAAAKYAEKLASLPGYSSEKQAPANVAAAPAEPTNWWEKTKSFVKENVIDPVNEKVIQPYVKPHVENEIEKAKNTISWVDKKVIQPYVKPHVENEIEKAKNAISWVDEKVIQPYVKPYIESEIQKAKKIVKVVNDKVVQPYVKPYIESEIQKAKKIVKVVNDKVVQPYVKPYIESEIQKAKKFVEAVNEKIVQPYIVPAVTAVNVKYYQPYVKPLVDKAVNQVNKAATWVDQNIYQPVFAPVVNDINKYIYQPLAQKASDAWEKYGEWVHGALDVAGFIPGFGEIADGINGLIYLGEGRYIEASISAAAMIPIIGDLGKAGKWTVKVGKELVEVAAEAATKQVLKTTAKKAAQQAVEKVVRESTEVAIDKATKKVLKKAAQEGAENALERSSKQVARVALATAREAGQEMSEQVVKDVARQSARQYLTSTAAKQVARDAAEKSAKVALDYPKGLAKYQEFIPTRNQISQKVQTAIPGPKPQQVMDNLKPLYRDITEAPLEWQKEFTQLQQVYSKYTKAPLKWDNFVQMKQLYSQADDATPALQNLIEKLAKQTNGTPQFRSELKDVERVLEKMAGDYIGDPSHLTDLTAGRIVYDNLEDLYRALDDIHMDDQLIYFKDRFLKPQDSGYRDILINVELPNGHIGELRLEVGPMNKAAEIEHQLYEIRRSFPKPLSPVDEVIYDGLEEQGQELYTEAWQEVIANFVGK